MNNIRRTIRRVKHRLLTEWYRRQLSRHGIMSAIARFHALRPITALPPDYGDLWFLYKKVRTRIPEIVWEFGSGCSTVVLAKALSENGTGHLYSMESSTEWLAATTSGIPTQLAPFCTIIHSPAEEVTYDERAAFRHRFLPDNTPNFVYLDGPPLTPQRNVAVDLLIIEDHLPRDFYLVIDNRQQNTAFLKEKFKRQYVFRTRKLFVQQIFELIS